MRTKAKLIKTILTDSGELIINGETATRSNPRDKGPDDIFESSNSDLETDNSNYRNTSNTSIGVFGNATITGKNVIFRENHSTTSKIIGKFY